MLREGASTLAIVLAATMGCSEGPVSPPTTAPPTGSGVPNPTILEVTQLRATATGPIEVAVRGTELATLKLAYLWLTGGPQLFISPVTAPVLVGDTLAKIQFLVEPGTANGNYYLKLDFMGEAGSTIRLAYDVVRVARPVPVIDSINTSVVAGYPDYFTVKAWGWALTSADTAVIDAAILHPPEVRSFTVTDSILDATYRVDPSWAAGSYDLVVSFHYTDSTAAVVQRLRSSVTLGSPAPLAVTGFNAAMWSQSGTTTHDVAGTGLGRGSSYRFVASDGSTGLLPGVRPVGWWTGGTYQEGPSILISGDGAPIGTYDLIVTEGAQSDTVLQALQILDPAPTVPLDIPPGANSASVDGYITYGSPACTYDWDWWGDFLEPCANYEITVPGPGTLVFALDFVPENCDPTDDIYGGLWLSLAPPGTGWGAGYYWTGCQPFSTAAYPTVVSDAGPHQFTVGLHAVPPYWLPWSEAQYTLTVSYLPPGGVVEMQSGSSLESGVVRAIRLR